MSTTQRKASLAEPGKSISRTELFESLADVFGQIGRDERVDKEESLAQMKEPAPAERRAGSFDPHLPRCRSAEGFASGAPHGYAENPFRSRGCRLNQPTGAIHKKFTERICDVREVANIKSWQAGA